MPPSSTKPLSRKITAEEALEGYLLVEKAWLKKLPAPGTAFQLKLGNSNEQRKVQIQTAACTCGKKTPHEHYKLSLPLISLEEGMNATLRPVNAEKVVLELAA